MTKLIELAVLSGEITKAENGVSALLAKRNKMIVDLSKDHSLREIAAATGLSHPTVMRIIRKSRNSG